MPDTPEPEHHDGQVFLTGKGNVEEIDMKSFSPEFLDWMRNEAARQMGVDPETLTLTSVTATKTEEAPEWADEQERGEVASLGTEHSDGE